MTALEGADVVMMLRMQLERQGKSLFPSVREYFRHYGLDAEAPRAREEGRDRHAPRADEPRRRDRVRRRRPGRSVILEQVANGVAVRMAVLYLLLGGHPWEGEA